MITELLEKVRNEIAQLQFEGVSSEIIEETPFISKNAQEANVQGYIQGLQFLEADLVRLSQYDSILKEVEKREKDAYSVGYREGEKSNNPAGLGIDWSQKD
jgi:hypothetical protein